MRYLHHLLFFLFTFRHANTFTFSEPSSRLSNTTHTSLLNPTALSLLPAVALKCDPPYGAPPLDEDDCFIALQQLPSHSEHARFHRDSGRVPYKPPLSVSIGYCRIMIDLIDHINEEESSWDQVCNGAASLLTECVQSQEGLGGNALVGTNLLIQVTVQYIEAAGRSNNSTILSSRTPSSSFLDISVLNCYPPGTGGAPDFPDCLLAQDLMVYDSEWDIFHRGGADDGYRLPERFDHQTCDISIDLVDDVQEEISSWLDVALDTELLIFSCVQEGLHLGGHILVGYQHRIRVTVEYIDQTAGGNNNSATLLREAAER